MIKNLKKTAAILALTGMSGAFIQLAFMQGAPTVAAFEPSGYNSLNKQNLDGTTTTEIHAKFINYVDTDNKWKKIDLTPVSTADGWEVTKAPYTVKIPKKANGQMQFISTNRYSIKEKAIRNDSPISKYRTFTGAKNVDGVSTKDGILYSNAFPSIGASLLLQPHEEEMRYLIQWDSKPSACTDDSVILEVPFRQNFSDGLKPKKKNGQDISSGDEVINGFSVKTNDFRGIATTQARIWDSGVQSRDIDIVAKSTPAFLFGKKQIPCSFFTDNVLYPVRSDDTDTFYPDPSVEVTTVDGFARTDNYTTWNAAHDDPGDAAADSVSSLQGYSRNNAGGSSYSMGRTFMLFDITSLSDLATIMSAQMKVTTTATNGSDDVSGDDDNDAQAYVAMVGAATPASNTEIVAGDYDACGAVDNPTLYSDKLDLTGINTSTQYTFTLTAAAITHIQTAQAGTNIVKIGYREGHDIEDASLSGTNQRSGMTLQSSETTGTSGDPQLLITYTAPAASPSGPPLQVIIISMILDYRHYS